MAPPPMYGPAPRSSGNKTWIIIGSFAFICCAGVVVAAILMVTAGKGILKNVMSMGGCTQSMEHLSRSLQTYAQEHGGKLPPAENWQKSLEAAYKKIPARSSKDNPFKSTDISGTMLCQDHEGTKTGIAYNTDVAGKKLADAKFDTVTFFEVPDTGKNLARKYTELSKDSSPKIFGQSRGWISVNISGDVRMDGEHVGNMGK